MNDAPGTGSQDASPVSTPLLDDQPSTVDLLDFEQFVNALDAVIRNPQTKTPIIMGVFGRWGTGKSTLMRMLQRRIETRGTTTVWFNAWLYNKETEIWAALLQSLTTTLSKRLSARQKLRFAFGLHERSLDWSGLVYQIPRWSMLALGVLIPLLAGYLLSQLFPNEVGQALTQVGGLVGSAAVLYATVLRPMLQTVRERVQADFSPYRSVDYQSHIGFLDRFREQFARIVESVPSTAGRVVVFIDDLDRCGPDKALEVLDTIKVFLDVPGCVFVLGVDIAVIHGALRKKYPDDPVAQTEYLSKIVQLPFHLPPLMDADLRGYIDKLAVRFPDARCGEVLLAGLARNPRELKRVINTYALHWYLAQARRDADDVTPVRLAKVVVIQQSFAGLFDVLRAQPALLGVLERSLRGGDAATSQPDPSLAGVTVITTAAGVSLPASLHPFAEDENIRKLLTMHGDSGADDDATFGALSEDALVVYFNLTHRFGLVPASGSPASPAGSPWPDPATALDFGPRYAVVERLAIGGASEVYLADDRETRTRVVVKRLVASLIDDPTWAARFEREIQVLGKVGAHPHIAAVRDAGTGHDADRKPFAYYVMDHVAGDTLQTLLARRGPLPPVELRAIFGPILEALAFLHAREVVHRDLKPSSIVVTPYGVPYLIDFGLAIEGGDGKDEYTRIGQIIGTPAYMAPEQLYGQPFGPASDLFSLGVVLYESATGVNPLKGVNAATAMRILAAGSFAAPTSIVPTLPAGFDPFIARMLAVDPTRRPANATAAREAFDEALAADDAAGVRAPA